MNRPWTASPSVHSGAFTLILLSIQLSCPEGSCSLIHPPLTLVRSGRTLSSVRTAQLKPHLKPDSVKNLFMRFRVTSHRHVLLLLALKNNISTVFTLPIFSLIYSYVPVNVVFTPNYWILVKSTNYVTPLMVFPSKCIANFNWIAAENFFCRFTAKCKL